LTEKTDDNIDIVDIEVVQREVGSYNASSSTPPTTRQSSYLYPRLIQSVEDIRHAKALLFGDSDSKTTDTEAPAEATLASK